MPDEEVKNPASKICITFEDGTTIESELFLCAFVVSGVRPAMKNEKGIYYDADEKSPSVGTAFDGRVLASSTLAAQLMSTALEGLNTILTSMDPHVKNELYAIMYGDNAKKTLQKTLQKTIKTVEIDPRLN